MSAAATARMAHRFAAAAAVADAVLYEGYVLYPYNAGAAKNQGGARFQWGVLVPPAWHAVDPYERSLARTELVVDPASEPLLAVRVRFLQLQHRALEEVDEDGRARRTERLAVGDRSWIEWDETVEREVDLPRVPLLPVREASQTVALDVPPTSVTELVTAVEGDPTTAVRGRILRTTEQVSGEVRVSAEWAAGPGVLLKVRIEVENTTAWRATGRRGDALHHALIAVTSVAALEAATFCSPVDPPEYAAQAVAECHSVGLYPVLIGTPGDTDVVLASPIILPDYPAIAPESEGDFHDGCEIDELLALRALTLTDEEKAAARATDARARAVVDRCDDMDAATWDRLHGAVREIRTVAPAPEGLHPAEPAEPAPLDLAADASLDPWTDAIVIRDVPVAKGSRVRLAPSRRADVHDLFLAGATATVAGVFHDVDGVVHVAVTLEGDPAGEVYEFQGRFYYFQPDELEPLPAEPSAGVEVDPAGKEEAPAPAPTSHPGEEAR